MFGLGMLNFHPYNEKVRYLREKIFSIHMSVKEHFSQKYLQVLQLSKANNSNDGLKTS
jgi:hypothetical protein